jgi:hypothetical protein
MSSQSNVGPVRYRVGGLAAIGFATLIVLANVILLPAGAPSTGAGLDEVLGFFGANSAVLGVASALTPAAWALATVFGAVTVAAARRSGDPGAQAWSLTGFAGIVAQNVTFLSVVALRLALTSPGARDERVAGALWTLHDAVFTLNGTFLALALVGLSIGGRRARLIRRWHRTLGLVAAGLLFASATLTPLVLAHPGPLGPLGLVGWLLWVAWLVAYGLRLLRGDRAPDASAERVG